MMRALSLVPIVQDLPMHIHRGAMRLLAGKPTASPADLGQRVLRSVQGQRVPWTDDHGTARCTDEVAIRALHAITRRGL
jgi:hypothetical protein